MLHTYFYKAIPQSCCRGPAIAGLIFLLTCIVASPASAQRSCDGANTISATDIIQNATTQCCGKSGKARRRCLQRGRKTIRGMRSILEQDVVRPARQALLAMKRSSCPQSALRSSECSDPASTTVDEATFAIQLDACDLTYKKERKQTLRKKRRSVKRARRYIGSTFAKEMRQNIRALLRAKSCGAGGEKQPGPSCNVVDPRDGYKIGNVYKLSDHSPHNPVFITHNGARSGSAISSSGEHLDTLKYTGLANGDSAGLRHHYRFNRSCGSLPSGFLIKLGSTCYKIDSPCSRLD